MKPFDPPILLRNRQVQSALASLRFRNRHQRGHEVLERARQHTLDCGDGVRLQCYHSVQAGAAKGLVVLIHGWEGSHESAYQVSFACALYSAGYNVFRLNLRDHGGTHHLNEELFHSARLGEVLGALKCIRAIDASPRWFVVGFSLGGNFALRIGLRGHELGVQPDLALGICPAINPGATLHALDHGPRLFHRYFISKWRATLEAKQAAWPGKFDFGHVLEIGNFTEITRRFVEKYTEYGELDRYLATYTLTPAMLMESPGKLAIITAQDDPVVPFRDFSGLEDSAALRFLAPAHGGHCGFIDSFRMHCWAEDRALELFDSA